MGYDIVIRGGRVIDGTGAAAIEADVAIAGQRVAAIGSIAESGRREIDATGRFVTPGFIDIHTHLDAQIMWDPQVTSPCWHGITTVVMGNCGLSLAPAAPEDLEQLIHILESVEDIPGPAMLAGNRFGGGSFGDYLDMLDGLPKGLNVAAMVGHVAVRVQAMGERSFDSGPTPEQDVAKMCKLVRDGIDSGAFGFSTSRSLLHTAPDGRHIPGTHAETDELMAIGRVLEDVGRGIFGSVPAVEVGDPALHRKEIDRLEGVARRFLSYARPTPPERRAIQLSAVVSRTVELIEAQAREHPEQYLWIHRRFKTRPTGEPKLYPQKPGRRKKTSRASKQAD